MSGNGLFAKEVTIRLADDGTGFLYTVKHRWFGLQTGQIRLFEENEIPGAEVPRKPQRISRPMIHFKEAGASVPGQKE
jgi:hypothetical protein